MLFSRNRAVVPSANNLHATDETLEQYAMGRLSLAVLEEFEEHLLICAACQVRLAAADAWLAQVRHGNVESRGFEASAGSK